MSLRGGDVDKTADGAVRGDDVHFAVIGLDRKKSVADRNETEPRSVRFEIARIRISDGMPL